MSFGLNLGLGLGGSAKVSGGSSFDEDAQAYFDAVTSNGGSLTDAQKTATDTFVTTLKTNNIWDEGLECVFLWNNVATAEKKVKHHPNDSPTLVMTNFVDGDFVNGMGLQGDGSTKYIQSDCVLIDHYDYNNQYVGVFKASNDTNGDVGLGSGTLSGSIRRTYVGYESESSSNDSDRLNGDVSQHTWDKSLRDFIASAAATTDDVHFYRGTTKVASKGSAPNSTASNHSNYNIEVFGYQGASFLYDGIIRGYWVGGYLTEEQNTILNNAFKALYASVISYDEDVLIVVGDSITEGFSATTEANRWANIVATNHGKTLDNNGDSGSTLQSNGASDNLYDNFYDRILEPKAAYMVIMYGVNDMRSADCDINTFTSELDEILDTAINTYNMDPAKICIASPTKIADSEYDQGGQNGNANATKQDQYRDACSDAATLYGCKFADCYQAFLDDADPDTNLLSGDGIHPVDPGHAVCGATINAATTDW